MRLTRITVVSLLIIASIVFGALSVLYPLKTITVIGGVGGYVILLVQILYSKWDSFYFFIQKIKFAFFNPDTVWNLTVKYKGKIDSSTDQITRKLINSNLLQGLKVNNLTSTIVEYRAKGIILQLIISEQEVEVHLLDLPVSHNKALNIISNIITPLLELIETAIHPSSKEYFLKVMFEGTNPFYGLYLNKITHREILDFDVTFMLENKKVEVSKESITLYTNSIPELMNLSQEVLIASPR